MEKPKIESGTVISKGSAVMGNGKKIEGLDLMDYKDIEREAMAVCKQGRKMVVSAQLMLDNARKCIKEMDGLTSDEEDEADRKRQQEMLEQTV